MGKEGKGFRKEKKEAGRRRKMMVRGSRDVEVKRRQRGGKGVRG